MITMIIRRIWMKITSGLSTPMSEEIRAMSEAPAGVAMSIASARVRWVIRGSSQPMKKQLAM